MGVIVSLVGQARPIGVTTAAVLQLLLVVTFLIMPIVVIRDGTHGPVGERLLRLIGLVARIETPPAT